MPCKPLEPITEPVDIEVELSFQYDRLRLIFNNDEEHPFLKGFKYAMDLITEQ
jgi:hypothetical protein